MGRWKAYDEPPKPGLLRSCPACGKWFALKPTQTQQHPTYGSLLSFRCKFCGKETTFAQKLPPRAVAGRGQNPLLRLPAVGDNAAMQAEPSKAEPPKRKRRWFQFSLRTLLIGVTLLAIGSAWMARRIERNAGSEKQWWRLKSSAVK